MRRPINKPLVAMGGALIVLGILMLPVVTYETKMIDCVLSPATVSNERLLTAVRKFAAERSLRLDDFTDPRYQALLSASPPVLSGQPSPPNDSVPKSAASSAVLVLRPRPEGQHSKTSYFSIVVERTPYTLRTCMMGNPDKDYVSTIFSAYYTMLGQEQITYRFEPRTQGPRQISLLRWGFTKLINHLSW